jgi:hypothetical protein
MVVSLAGLLLMPGAVLGATTPGVDNVCNTVDASARSVVEQYLGDDVWDFSIYNTTRGWRLEHANWLQAKIIDDVVETGGVVFDVEALLPYILSLGGYAGPCVVCLLLLLLFILPLMFVRCCCAKCCCKPHHPLWGQGNGTLEDYPEPKCCGGSRKQKPGEAPPTNPKYPVRP